LAQVTEDKGGLAQLARALDLHSRGQGFDSLILHQRDRSFLKREPAGREKNSRQKRRADKKEEQKKEEQKKEAKRTREQESKRTRTKEYDKRERSQAKRKREKRREEKRRKESGKEGFGISTRARVKQEECRRSQEEIGNSESEDKAGVVKRGSIPRLSTLFASVFSNGSGFAGAGFRTGKFGDSQSSLAWWQ
jgi:hypothetical protein